MRKHFDYGFEEFLKHFDDFAKLPRDEDERDAFMRGMSRIRDYMQSQFSDPEEARDKGFRFTTIMMYLADHVDDWDVGDYGVKGDKMALVSEPILRAVHQLLNDRRILSREPSPEQVLHLAREMRAVSNDHDEDTKQV
jgi:hypothetical protein